MFIPSSGLDVSAARAAKGMTKRGVVNSTTLGPVPEELRLLKDMMRKVPSASFVPDLKDMMRRQPYPKSKGFCWN